MTILTQRSPRPARHAIVEIAAFVALAIGIGLATGIALGGTVLLLSDSGDSTIATAAAMRANIVARD